MKSKKKSSDKLQRLLRTVAENSELAEKLYAIDHSEPVVFEHVTESAQAFLAAVIANKKVRNRRYWIVCSNVRSQEKIYNELLTFIPHALLFPEQEIAAIEGALPDPEIAAERLAVLERFFEETSNVIVLTTAALEESTPTQTQFKKLRACLKVGQNLDLSALSKSLVDAGYERVTQVYTRGQFVVRGGILDVFSWQHQAPVRIELFGDEIESIREFDLDEQISIRVADSAEIMLGEPEDEVHPLREEIRAGDVVISIEQNLSQANVEITSAGSGEEQYETAFFDHGLGQFDAGDLVIAEARREHFFAQLRDWQKERNTIILFCNNEGEAERFDDLIAESGIQNVEWMEGNLAGGFLFPSERLVVLSDNELFGRYRVPSVRRLAERRAKLAAGRSQIDFTELNEGDYIVHLEHGIGIFCGLETLPENEDEPGQEVLVLEFANHAKLYVPVEHSYLVSRYVGLGKKHPALNSLADKRWARAKQSAEKSVFDYAVRLLKIHAEREAAQGFAFAPDGRWQSEFERSFVYRETPDQLKAIAETKADMESVRPMDRLICGDVGFGKTEVAVRAAFKAVMTGKQVALLVPTTVLAQQHYHHFRERMSEYPVQVEMLSRFRTAANQRSVVEGLANGSVDIVVGTHRLLSKDVLFKDLGLVVVDEEQRFGVLHKERLKERFHLIDVLTLSATPIPRTLYLSMMGARDMSLIETPPTNRLPVETIICGYDERVIRDAIRRELARQGQVYFLHNRIHSIEHVRKRIADLCPEARIDVGHGRMEEDELEAVMMRFVEGKTDVLISTTIIESGLDIPNANTIIIDRADRFGLADLYQLRGRVGRAQHKAYAYFLLPRDMMTVGAARKRINAIKQYSSLGAGFKIAMRDLEIRGAGNILGTAQSGHIINVGFDLYCQLLRQAVTKLKGESVESRVDVPMILDFVATTEADGQRFSEHAQAFLPGSWISDARLRIKAYREIAELTSLPQLEQLRKNWRDRFGELPMPVDNLLIYAEVRLIAHSKKITKIEVRDNKLMLTKHNDFILIDGKFPRLTASDANLNLRLLLKLVRTL